MKIYEIVYIPSSSDNVESMTVFAETEKDVIDYFFRNYSGRLLRVNFVGWK